MTNPKDETGFGVLFYTIYCLSFWFIVILWDLKFGFCFFNFSQISACIPSLLLSPQL